MHVYTQENIVYEYERVVAEIDKSGGCSVIRKNKITATLQTDPLYGKKFKLYGGRSIQFYADKIGKSIEDLDPDKEFKIIARDVTTGARLASSTQIEGENKDVLVTNVLFDNPITLSNSLETEIEYHNLGVSFYLTNLLEEPHICEWFIKPDTQINEMEVTIKFPEILPDWFTKSEIGVSPIPQDWVQARKYIDNGRRCVLLRASDLKVGIIYKVKIDAGEIGVGHAY